MNAPPRLSSVIMCFSHLRWNFVYQRPQHLLSRAARRNTVYFFEEPIVDETVTAPRVDMHTVESGVIVVVPVVPPKLAARATVDLQRRAVRDVAARHAGQPIVFWYYTAMALTYTAEMTPDLCLYDCMDELSAFRGAPAELTRLEDRLFSLADLVFTGGRSLFEAKRDRHSNVHEFASSIDRNHFGAARRPQAEPADQAPIGGPRIGFFGVVDERMDVELVGEIARLRPDLSFVMLGPVVKIDPATLPKRENLHWLGAKRYEELPAYLAGWDAGFMPFAINESTRYISPTKTPEFLAAGLPVVSTAIRDVVTPYGAAGLVEIATTAESLSDALDRARAGATAEWLARVDRFLAPRSWDRTFADMNALIEQGLAQRSARVRRRAAMAEALSGGAAHA